MVNSQQVLYIFKGRDLGPHVNLLLARFSFESFVFPPSMNKAILRNCMLLCPPCCTLIPHPVVVSLIVPACFYVLSRHERFELQWPSKHSRSEGMSGSHQTTSNPP